jgi:thioredoxin 1
LSLHSTAPPYTNQQILTKINRYSKQYTDVRFYKIDVDEVPDVAQDLGIRAMPTFLVFKDGEKVDEVVGANPKAIEAAILKHQ